MSVSLYIEGIQVLYDMSILEKIPFFRGKLHDASSDSVFHLDEKFVRMKSFSEIVQFVENGFIILSFDSNEDVWFICSLLLCAQFLEYEEFLEYMSKRLQITIDRL